jgi:hypothetical protein
MAVVHRLLSKQEPFQIVYCRSITVLSISLGLQAVKFSDLKTKKIAEIEACYFATSYCISDLKPKHLMK